MRVTHSPQDIFTHPCHIADMHTDSTHFIVIDPALHTPERACFENIQTLSNAACTYTLPGLTPDEPLPQIQKQTAGVIVLGSGASVYDERPWQTALHSWIYDVVEADIPFLGLCYGHQALAHVYAGQIDLIFNGEKKRGRRLMELTDPRILGQREAGRVIVSHREGITSMPEGFNIIAKSVDCAIDGIAHKDKLAWGYQPHIEAVPAFLSNNDIQLDFDEADFMFGHKLLRAFFSAAYEHRSLDPA